MKNIDYEVFLNKLVKQEYYGFDLKRSVFVMMKS